ncbi:MAG: DUF1465 family protein [Hyphomicrobiaceae bacterium]
MTARGEQAPQTISFAERFARSEQFDRVFREGMALVERTAAYLDGEGRGEARKLKPPVSIAYATESMRLTTRLLELASWLLVRRAIKAGEISEAEAAAKRARIKLSSSGRPSHILRFQELPEGLRKLIEESFLLNDRILQLDRALEGAVAEGRNPVGQQQQKLEAAFQAGARLSVRGC